MYVHAFGNVDYAEKLALTAGVYSNEVSGHGHRHDYYDSQTPYGPIMKFRHLNVMNKFQIDFTIMSVDTTENTMVVPTQTSSKLKSICGSGFTITLSVTVSRQPLALSMISCTL